MAYEYDDELDDDLDLDEDELAERREDRMYMRRAREQAAKRYEAVHEQYIGKLFQSGSDYLKQEEATPLPWLVESFIPCGSLVILGGNSKSGKTCLATALAMAVAKGEPFLGNPTRTSPVLWCAYEESRHERLSLIQQFGGLPDHFFTSHPNFKIDSEVGEKALRLWTKWLRQPPLIVVDPLFGATDANLAEGRAARKALMGLKRLAGETLATVIVIHHVNKDTSAGLTRERFAESNQLLATASMDILMDSRDMSDGSREIRLQGRGRGAHANRTWFVRSTGPTDFQLLADGQSGVSKGTLRTDAVLNVLATSETPLTTEELSSRCGLKVESMRNLLRRLLQESQITIAGSQGKSRLFALQR